MIPNSPRFRAETWSSPASVYELQLAQQTREATLERLRRSRSRGKKGVELECYAAAEESRRAVLERLQRRQRCPSGAS